MKIAIMGAGLSGLACAITLEKHGITPAIFEKRSEVGDRFVNGEIFLEVLNKPIKNVIAYLSENHHLYIQPSSHIRKLILSSKNHRATIEGCLGYTSVRGRHEFALEKQLARQVNTEILFHSEQSYEHLLRDYTHVVLATGDAAYAALMKNYREDLNVRIKGATFEGNFEPTTVHAWLNHQFAPKGYAYVIPFSHREMNAVIAYPNYPETREADPDILWKRFEDVLKDEFGPNLNITDTFHISNYIIGISPYPRIGNTFLTGNCFCAIGPFLGFGQLIAMLTGVYAAYDLLGKGNYVKLSSKLIESYHNSLVLRRALEAMDNSDYDIFVSLLSKSLGNRIFNSRFNLLRTASKLLKPWMSLRK